MKKSGKRHVLNHTIFGKPPLPLGAFRPVKRLSPHAAGLTTSRATTMGDQLNSDTAVEFDPILAHDIPDEAIEAAASVDGTRIFALVF